jgi:uncharacterized OsmC-like protein
MKSNGVDLQLWESVKEAVQEDLEEAQVIIRTAHRWTGGFGIEGHTKEIESAGEITPRAFEFKTDWPEDVGGADTGPSPGEAILGALAGCVGLSYVANAINRGVEIDRIEIVIEASADLGSVFEAGNTRPGFSNIEILVKVGSNADPQTLADLGQAATRTSTVFDSLVSPVPVTLTVQAIR